MQAFAELIAESFQSEVYVTWKLHSTTHVIASFAVKSIAVEVNFEQREDRELWHVSFNTVHVDLADRTNITSAFRIFNGVFQAVREFVEVREPEMMIFVAKDEDLASIYEVYLRRERSSIEELGYRIEEPHTVAPYAEWILRRMTTSKWRADKSSM